jgi:adenine-specific DNA-methyltransferase
MTNNQPVRTMRGIQQSLMIPPPLCSERPLEPKGVVYTKRWVVDLLLHLAGYRAETNLVDAVAVEPAAGEGAFLVAMIERLVASCRRLNRPFTDCESSLIAFELDIHSAGRARELAVRTLSELGMESGAAQRLASSWVRTGDYLFEAATIEADFVIGNPPYVRLEDIPADRAALYRDCYTTMRGRADLYVAFFEAGLRQLKDFGVCAFICADRWMRNQYGGELRELITSEYAVEVVVEMHNADAFDDEVDAYPAITVIRRKNQDKTIVATAGSEAEVSPPETLAAALSVTSKSNGLPAGLRSAVVDSWFKGADPWPCHSPAQLALLRSLEERFAKLESYAKVGIGVATGNDRVFITKDPNLVEPSRLLKLALGSDISSGKMAWSGHFLIDPWDSAGLVSLAEYPLLSRYFEQHAMVLQQRHTAQKNARGWYKTIDRVTHALTHEPKLYVADIKNVFDPVLDVGETYPHHNLYYIQSGLWDLEVLGGLLMSSIGQFFVESYGVRMRGGYLRFQAQYLRRIRVPAPDALSPREAADLKSAFRARDRVAASQTALAIYGVGEAEMERALGY